MRKKLLLLVSVLCLAMGCGAKEDANVPDTNAASDSVKEDGGTTNGVSESTVTPEPTATSTPSPEPTSTPTSIPLNPADFDSELEYLLSLPCTERPEDVWLFEDNFVHNGVHYWTDYNENTVSFPSEYALNNIILADDTAIISLLYKSDQYSKYVIITENSDEYFVAEPKTYSVISTDEKGNAIDLNLIKGVFTEYDSSISLSSLLSDLYFSEYNKDGIWSNHILEFNFNPLHITDAEVYKEYLDSSYLIAIDANADSISGIKYKVRLSDLGDWFINHERYWASLPKGDGKTNFEFNLRDNKYLDISWTTNYNTTGDMPYLTGSIDIYCGDITREKIYSYSLEGLDNTSTGSFQLDLESLGVTSDGHMYLKYKRQANSFETSYHLEFETDEPVSATCIMDGNTAIFSGDDAIINDETFNNDIYIWEAKTIIIEEGITEITDYQFMGYYDLETIVFPSSLTHIGNNVFSRCASLTEINLPKNLVSIGDEAFSQCNLSKIIIPEGVKSIGKAAFYVNCNLTEVTLPSSLTYIGEGAFSTIGNINFIYEPGSYAETWLRDNGYIN